MKPIKLSELADMLEFDSPDFTMRVDLKEGRVVTVEESLLQAIEEGDEESLTSVPEWEKEMVQTAREMAADPGERFVGGPSKFDFHEYRHMERFIQTVESPDAVDQLWRAIKGKGAFRYFKDTAHRLGLLKAWYRYRDEQVKQFVIEWAEARNVPYEDDLPRTKS